MVIYMVLWIRSSDPAQLEQVLQGWHNYKNSDLTKEKVVNYIATLIKLFYEPFPMQQKEAKINFI